MLGNDNIKLHVPICQDEMKSLGEDTHVVPLFIPNLLQDIQPQKDEEQHDDIASCEHSRPSCHVTPSTTAAHESKGNAHGATRKVRIVLMC
jgi:hypothetical protein